jgi:DNA-directed RNA polymerase subunit RPC12/RpoP
MAKKKLGYQELQWTCPNCNGINPGPEKACIQCGAPQPDDVDFEQVKGAELLEDEAVEARVKAGPDIHCPYCEARNPGDAQVCSQCGGDLEEGQRRESGKVLGAYKEEKEAVAKIPCPNCGSENLETEKNCSQCGASLSLQEEQEPTPQPAGPVIPDSRPGAKRKLPVGLIIFLVVICFIAAIFLFMTMRTEATTGTVERVGWERSIAIEGLVPVEYRDWIDQIPSEGEILRCEQEERYVESEPQPNAVEVCGTPYSVDTGSGYAEIVQDCEYHVYDDLCTYSVIEWAVVDTLSLSGNDFYPEWPAFTASNEQRQGDQTETYVVYFDTDQGTLSYSLNDYDYFQQFQIGSEWNLEVNAFGSVVSVEP